MLILQSSDKTNVSVTEKTQLEGCRWTIIFPCYLCRSCLKTYMLKAFHTHYYTVIPFIMWLYIFYVPYGSLSVLPDFEYIYFHDNVFYAYVV